MTIQEYARAVAEAVLDECYDEWGLEGGRRKQVDLDAIIASVPPPTAQHHAAPTCDGWWWVSVHGGEWQMKCVVGKTVWQNAQGESWRMSYSGWNARWVGPLLPPDTTEPAPVATPTCDIETQRARAIEALDYPPERENALRCLREHPETPTPDIDPEEVRRALGEYFAGKQYSEFAVDKIVAAAREYLRLREQPAPDVQVSPPSGTIGGARKALEYLEHIIARDHFDLAPLALRALELEVATMRGEMRTKRQTWPRTQDVPDISTWRQCGGGDSFATIEAEGKVLATIITDGGDTQPIAGRVLRTILKLREQPAPDVQAHCVGCGHAAHALDCSEQGCLCPHSTDVQAYKEMYECGYEAGRDEVQAQAEWCARLPDGSGAAVVSFPLPDNHWLTAEHENVPPMPFRMGTDDPRRTEWKNAIRDAGKYAVRCATMNGADNDFDPDALVQNLVVGMIGYFTPDGFSSDAWANPEQPTPAILTDTDAAVARERERIIELVELKRAKFNIGTRASLALNDVLDQIRARSAKGV